MSRRLRELYALARFGQARVGVGQALGMGGDPPPRLLDGAIELLQFDEPIQIRRHVEPVCLRWRLRRTAFAWHASRSPLTGKGWWARQDSNLGPTDYEPAALTAELRAPGAVRNVRKWKGQTEK